ncbi:Sec-independent protein translocase protein TatA [Dickeya dianthicola]|uniref:Probable Sec-independent protein translocase protein TatE n=2 Tax=Dickeya dianthicola TaxID=204039 RepID=A0ABX9NL72_9GAMM|nr:twin-arginine translocase subunit TatE [Dickeya dianthicola]AYC18164.1 Sec-independent protein translocase protein TatA [Dickeya dianthicola]MBI0437459.1 twin-arginine translocase subunit TatE [Dickeya dianthicola]MBI0448712.1 twin-arginine translocase subunit TatE [Dickeya dianthicola]MBI0453286.1 twin-arginine translocase subunit TatE [Dickeya dianthicola]MBI0457635.1 twin-arginine translocase subunit TatE [Dickeya dianthicola]
MEGISIAKLLVIGALIVLLFGTNKLRSLGSDLGAAIKGFKKSMSDEQPAAKSSAQDEHPAAKSSAQDEHPAAISENRPKE